MLKIEKIKARQILDSRGRPTIELELQTKDGIFVASVPSGASKGKREARELRDKGKKYLGFGVERVKKIIEEIIWPKLKGKKFKDQKELDQFLISLDGTKNKSKLGVNAIYPISVAFCKAQAKAKKLPLFVYIGELFEKKITFDGFCRPCFNLIEGGVHAANKLDFQEFLLSPKQNSFEENLRIGAEVYQKLKEILSKKYGKGATNVGDEGGFAPPMKFAEEAIEAILEAAQKLNYANKVSLILDVAASQFFDGKKYKTNFGRLSGEKLTKYYLKLIKNYPIEGIEDPFDQDDFDSWKNLMEELKFSSTIIFGDDLTTTNLERIKMAKKLNLCNGTIIKINQVGTVSEALEAAKLAKSFGWKILSSHRSGETNDDFLADFSVGIFADFLKAGAPARGERVAKYNRLLKIEKEIGEFKRAKKNSFDCN